MYQIKIKEDSAMNADAQLLKKTIDLLKRIRSETHGRWDDSAVQTLDEVIKDLEAEFAKDEKRIKTDKVLKLLGKFINVLPFISKLIDMLAK